MSLDFSAGGENATPVLDEDDPARRKLTIFSKEGIRRSYKCPIQDRKQAQSREYGFYTGHLEIENPIEVIQGYCCQSLVKILEQSNNPGKLVENILRSTSPGQNL